MKCCTRRISRAPLFPRIRPGTCGGIPAIVRNLIKETEFNEALAGYAFAQNADYSDFNNVLVKSISYFCKKLDKLCAFASLRETPDLSQRRRDAEDTAEKLSFFLRRDILIC